MSGLCKYSNVFGAPGEGSHKYRIGGLAAVDLIATAGLAFLLTRFAVRKKDFISFFIVFIILILVGILAHEAFCVNTRFNATLFGRDWPGPSTTLAKAT